MLLQTLLLVTVLTVLGGSLLASTLVSAKAAFHAKVMRAGESAMNDATADFVAWARRNVRDNGIDQLPVWSAAPQTIGPASVCVAAAGVGVGADPAAVAAAAAAASAAAATAAGQGATAVDSCKLFETIHWNVTGYSGSATPPSATETQSLAAGLSSSQNEQRVSVTLTVAISDVSQSMQYATRSRELTARVFHSAPYVAVTGARDAASQVGAISSAEGDTAGYTSQNRNEAESAATPDPLTPASYADTTIKTTVNCLNTRGNTSRDALADNKNVVYSQLRNYGNIAWVYEMPCRPMQRIDPATAPVGYEAPISNVYRTESTFDSKWTKNDENGTSFAW